MEELTRYLKALVLLQLQGPQGGALLGKPEILLARAGFQHKEIAELLGKSQAAVAKSISRGKASRDQEESNE